MFRKLSVTPSGKIRKVQASKLKSVSDYEENSFKKCYTINVLSDTKDNFVWAGKKTLILMTASQKVIQKN